MFDKLKITVSEYRSRKKSKNEYYDFLTKEIISKVLNPESVCVDVGCHSGSILSLMLNYCPNGQYYAFEPLPEFFEILQKDFNRGNIDIYNVALSDVESEIEFNHVITNPQYSGIKKRRYDREGEEDEIIRVKTNLLDNYLMDEDKVGFIKVDVEGGELQVFKGGIKTIKKHKPYIVFEHGMGGAPFYNTIPEQVFDFFVECDMKISLMNDWLLNKSELDRKEFCRQYYEDINFYFIAHN